MSTIVTLNSVSYTIPATGDDNWGDAVSSYIIALATGVVTKAGGPFTLTADLDFGSNFGLKSLYYKSRGTNIAATGVIRLASAESLVWRNNANTADLALTTNSSDTLLYNSVPLVTSSLADGTILIGNSGGVATPRTLSGDVTVSDTGVTAIGSGKVTSAMIVDGTIVDADISSSAAITYSKLASMTSGSILLGSAGAVPTVTAVSGDVTISNTGVTAIGSGKVTSTMILDGTILNADINASAAIAYSKLALTGSIVSADISGSISIAKGGTGQATAVLGFNALSPITTKGDLISFDGINNVRFAAGSDGKVLAADSTKTSGLSWITAGLTNPMTTTGDILYSSDNSGTATRLGIGASGTVLKGGTTPSWATIVNADVSSSAAIAYSKLSLTGSIVNADISSSAAIAGSKIAAASSSLTGTVSYEDSGTFSCPFTMSGIAFQTSTITYRRVGKVVTLVIPANNVSATAAATVFAAAGTIPSALRPPSNIVLSGIMVNASSILGSPGAMTIATDGSITISSNYSGNNFSASGNCGLVFQQVFTYLV